LWAIEHHVLSYDSFVKNKKCVTVVQRGFVADSTVTEIRVFPLITQSYVGFMHFAHE
ncbi:hypothetical protein SK128_000651, partial [Halocaridina rubra]